MNIERLKQIAFAEGAVEDFIESSLKGAAPELTEQAAKLMSSWQMLSIGLKELREENIVLSEKLERAKVLLGEHLLESN